MAKIHLKILSLAFLIFNISSSYAIGPLKVISPIKSQKIKQPQSLIKKVNVFGAIDKKPIGEERFKAPYIYIGKLSSPDNKFSCTASLIAEKLILTSAHCLVDEDNDEYFDLFTFKLGYYYGDSIAETKAEIVDYGSLKLKSLYIPENRTKGVKLVGDENDWAILKLKAPLGKKYGHFNLHSPLNIKNNLNRNITQAGYGVAFEGAGEEITAHENCNIRKYRKGGAVLDTDCEISLGDSGSPLFKCTQKLGCVVLGVVAGQAKPKGAPEGSDTYLIDRYHDNLSNKAAGSIMIESALEEALLYD
jgi:V8-like Glu-specific endopeptidase